MSPNLALSAGSTEDESPVSTAAVTNSEELLPNIDKKILKSRSTSCYLCQKRKQKCDQRLPSCTNCLKSKIQCIKPPRYGELNNSNNNQKSNNDYTNFLEKKVKQLEKLLDLKKLNNKSINNSSKLTQLDKKIISYSKISQFIPSSEGMDHQTDYEEHLDEEDTKEGEFSTDGSNRKIKQENDSCRGQCQYSKNNSNPLPVLNDSDKVIIQPYETFIKDNQTQFSNSCIKKYNLNDFLKFNPILNIDQKFSRNLIHLYFKMLQYKFPLLNEREVFNFNDILYDNPKDLEFNDNYHFQCSRMFFIYSIAALLYKSTGKYKGPNPFNFYSTALRHFILLSDKLNDFDRIDLLILMCFFLIRADKDSNNLSMIISDAMQSCIRLNLNKSGSYIDINPKIKDLKMRKFWCCYILERSILISISKPFVSEFKIDTDIPLFDYEPSKDYDPANDNQKEKLKIIFFNQSIKIKRLESKFLEDLSTLNSNKNISKKDLPKVASYFQDLQNWRNECQGFNNNGIENQTLLFYYYKSIRYLIQPYLELLDPNDKLFKECQAAAGQICQSIKSFHSKTFYGFSILNINLVFVAGITLIYCLWLQRNRDDMRRKLLGDDKKHTRPTVTEELFRGLDDLRACSISLYVMSERTRFALSFRDIFEEIMNATIGNLILRCGPDSSEILYRGIGLPPAIFRKPLKHFQVDSNFDKTEDEKLEDEETKKQKGHLTRSAIPKGLSHLLLHPPGYEYNEKDNGSGNSEFDKDKDASELNNRILPLPVKLPPLPQQSRLTSSLTSKSFENELKLISSNTYNSVNTSVSNPSKRKYSKTDSETESMVSLFPKSPSSHLHSSVLSPMLSQNTRTPLQSSHSVSVRSNSNSTAISSHNQTKHLSKSPQVSINHNISSPAVNSPLMNPPQPQQSSDIQQQNGIAPNSHQYDNYSIPNLFPFVGGTTAMISNISTWTEESGQQIPQTGLPMFQNAEDTGNGTNHLTNGNYYQDFYINGIINNSMINTTNGNGNGNGPISINSGNGVNNDNNSANNNFYFDYINNSHPSNIQGNYNAAQNNTNSRNQHNPNEHPNSGNGNGNENFNNLFDIVGNDEFWSNNNDLGFLP